MRKLLSISALVLLAAGCRYIPNVPMIPGLAAHKIDIQQGNYVTQEMVDKLKPGMTRSQVRFALGTPLVADPFHADRWDYVYVQQKKGRVLEKRRIVVVFKDDALVRIDGDVVAKGSGASVSAQDVATQPRGAEPTAPPAALPPAR